MSDQLKGVNLASQNIYHQVKVVKRGIHHKKLGLSSYELI